MGIIWLVKDVWPVNTIESQKKHAFLRVQSDSKNHPEFDVAYVTHYFNNMTLIYT